MNEIQDVVEHEKPGWLGQATMRYRDHPIVRTYVEAGRALASSHECIAASPEAIELMMLAKDIHALRGRLQPGRLAARLRDPDDCMAAVYELYVMAGYVAAGAVIEVTDQAGTGECRAAWGDRGPWVHLECKSKTVATLRPRHLKDVLDRGNELIQQAMIEAGRKALVWITCRQDPRVDELPLVVSLVREALEQLATEPVHARSGKFEISVFPSDEGVYDNGERRGVRVPAGFEYAFTEGKTTASKAGEPPMDDVWGVAWRTTYPQGWVRSALSSIREAGSRLGDDHPNVVYLQVPTGACGAVRARIEILYPVVAEILADHRRLNCVVLTGRCTRNTGPRENAVVSVAYRPVYNPSPQIQMPEGFRVLGGSLQATVAPALPRLDGFYIRRVLDQIPPSLLLRAERSSSRTPPGPDHEPDGVLVK